MNVAYHERTKAHWGQKTHGGHRYADEHWLKKYADEILFLLPHGGTLLDVGCGACELTVYLASAFDFVYAIDFSESMLAAARERLHKRSVTNIKLTYGQAEKFPSEIDNVNCVLSYGMVQYLDNQGFVKHLQECYRVLNKKALPGSPWVG